MIKSKKTRVEIFGSADDPEISATIKRLQKAGHVVSVKHRPAEATGLGPCGKHYCSCTESCEQPVTQKHPNLYPK